MAKIDNVLEAEKTISDIASELEKMKTAADLLNSSQEKTEGVIAASEAIVTKMNDFVVHGAEIVNKIGEYDIQADVKILLSKIDDVGTNIESRIDDIEELQSSNFRQLMLLSGFNVAAILALLIRIFFI